LKNNLFLDLKIMIYYDGLHNNEPINVTTDEIINTINKTKITNDIFTRRIGSKSENAEVFKCILNGIPLAVKTPRNDKFNRTESFYSIELTKYPDYFVKTYSIIQNNEIDYMFMELVTGDLRQELISGIGITILKSYINNVFESVSKLSSLNIIHGDLHIGNIFIRNNRAILADFDTIEPFQYVETPISDLVKFFKTLSAFLKTTNQYKDFTNKIDLFVVYLYKISNSIEEYEGEIDFGALELIDLIKDEWNRFINAV